MNIMNKDSRRTTNSQSVRGGFRSFAAILVWGMIITGVILPTPAKAFPVVAGSFFPMDDHLFATGIGYSLVAFAAGWADSASLPPTPNFQQNLTTGTTLDHFGVQAVSPVISGSQSEASTAGDAAFFGTLAGTVYAKGQTLNPSGGGTFAQATVTLEFMDMLQVTRNGDLDAYFQFHGGVEQDSLPGDPSGGSVASSRATAQLYVWRFSNQAPAPGTIFDASFFADLNQDTSHGRVSNFIGDLDNLQAGDLYWVAGIVTLQSVAETNDIAGFFPPSIVEATADFAHTAHFYIDPPAGSPDAGYIMASGADYRTPAVPIPLSLSLFASAMCVLIRVRFKPGRRVH